jgi:hypothetical protein
MGGRKHMHGFMRNLKERDCLGNLNGRLILKFMFKNWDERTWIGFIWLRKGATGRLLCTQKGNFRFHKMQGISLLAAELLTSQGYSFIESDI